ncbi:hypothetical protein A1O3_05347 [Capronia epimyces CBS 606.96]|uniref:Uncharacterized protein n=1 Tax=Capronia epimyces CBS 606.96 TaxID=1182542 RepID=W9XVS5_9EURO|nr:uncharacterized protein A1O3_05347 [Capronia epimyces CBS 606.96]EXJ84677.1 hypothetical protein A1O3_05347 [Capronia epimyces CBS 606.96]
MDTGLKKLWSRRKRKRHDGMRDSGVGSLRKSQSTDQTGRSITDTPRATHVHDYSIDHVFSHASPTSTATSPPISGPGTKMQPMLAGIVRPPTSLSRPGTSGSDSLMSAITRAADAIARSEQDYQASAEMHRQNGLGTKAPRYIDIFSLYNAKGVHSPSRYNEDVAERNLDLTRVALEGSQNGYISSSKFQEEVAIRNAYPSPPSDTSIKVSLLLSQDGIDRPRSSGWVGNMSSRTSNHPQIPRGPEHRPVSREQNVESSIGSHFRQQSDRSLEFQPQRHELPASLSQLNGVASTNRHPSHLSLATRPRLDGTADRSPEYSPNHTGNPSDHEPVPVQTLRSYQLTAAELTQARITDRPQPSQLKDARYTRGANGSQGPGGPLGSPSSHSNTPSVKRAIKLPNRTILDLTGDDSEVFSEGAPESNYSSSPVVEDAKLDTLRRIRGSAIIGPTAEDRATVSNSPRTKPTPGFSENVHARTFEVASAQQDQDSTIEPWASDTHPRGPRSTSAFSGINTIVSSSPRASVILGTPTTLSNGLATGGHSHPQEATPNQQSRAEEETSAYQPSIQKAPTKDENLVRKQAKAARVQVEQESGLKPRMIANGSAVTSQKKQNAFPEQDRSQATQASSSYSRDPGGMPSVQPYIHLASESLQPVDAVGANRAPGVIARDFADIAPKSTLSSVPEDAEPEGNRRPQRSGRLGDERRSHSPAANLDRPYAGGQFSAKPPIYESTIDEAGLARKQAEARAALIRLQESLNENFLQPIPAPLVRSSSSPGVSRRTSSFSDHDPVAPASIFTQIKNDFPEIKVEAEKSVDGGGSETSSHGLTTLPPTNGPEAVSRVKPSFVTAQRDDGRRNQKGKQRVDVAADLGGPGPPVLTDQIDLKQPMSLSLPPPHLFHLDGYISKQQQQPPPSPGEISLSSFPVPVSSPRQSARAANHTTGPPQDGEQQLHAPASLHSRPGSGSVEVRRQSSQRSHASSASAFSIPFHLIPGRSSSIRDQSVVEE